MTEGAPSLCSLQEWEHPVRCPRIRKPSLCLVHPPIQENTFLAQNPRFGMTYFGMAERDKVGPTDHKRTTHRHEEIDSHRISQTDVG